MKQTCTRRFVIYVCLNMTFALNIKPKSVNRLRTYEGILNTLTNHYLPCQQKTWCPHFPGHCKHWLGRNQGESSVRPQVLSHSSPWTVSQHSVDTGRRTCRTTLQSHCRTSGCRDGRSGSGQDWGKLPVRTRVLGPSSPGPVWRTSVEDLPRHRRWCIQNVLNKVSQGDI